MESLTQNFYDAISQNILQKLPPNAEIVVEIGCGKGLLGQEYKKNNPHCQYIGIESNSELTKTATENLDRVIKDKIEEIKLEDYNISAKSVDCIIYRDVLEDLLDPWQVLKQHSKLLKPEGKIIATIANIGHWSIIINLLKGQWQYQDKGAITRDRLRFFTIESIREMFDRAELYINNYSQIVHHRPEVFQQFINLFNPAIKGLNIDPNQFAANSKSFQYLIEASPKSQIVQQPKSNDNDYQTWLNANFPKASDYEKMARSLPSLKYRPVISAILPVYNTPKLYLEETIESILNQIYPNWELCIAEEPATNLESIEVLQKYAAKDSRIKIHLRKDNDNISRASNSGLEIATGDYILTLNSGDLLTRDALYEIAITLARNPNIDTIYCDEDKIENNGKVKDPFFKPDWCPDSLLSRMYFGNLVAYRKSLVEEIKGFRIGYEGAQNYDLALRITEKSNKIFHIPKILYHQRVDSELGDRNNNKDAAQKAISEAIHRRNEPGKVIPVAGGHHIVRYEIKDPTKLVSIIIPTKDLADILDNCLTSIFEKTEYPNYEVILIDNGSVENKTKELIQKWRDREPNRFKCHLLDIPFNYPKINNYAAKLAKGEYLLFLNNDTEVLKPDWLDAMVEQAQRESIGAVGALLLYPDRTIQHAGVVLGIGGIAGHTHKNYHQNSPGYFNQIQTVNNYSAVTAACLMCRREVFEAVGGFEEDLAIAFNDVDLCLKIREEGYRNIYLPHVVLFHYESKSRGYENTPEKLARFRQEIKYMQNKWQNSLFEDPCYNKHLSLRSEDYRLRI